MSISYIGDPSGKLPFVSEDASEGSIPKTLRAAVLERADAIESIHTETDDGQKSYWLYLREGFINTYLECGTIHETTAREAVRQIRNCIVTQEEWNKS